MNITLEKWKQMRQECRTNLIYLCKVLNYPDVNQRVHGRLIANLQTFKGGEDKIGERRNTRYQGLVLPTAKEIIQGYQPFVPNMWDLEPPPHPGTDVPGTRNRENMIPRGHLKTTIATFAHTIQWIINYPNVRILLSTHTDGAAKQFINEIRKHFTHNEQFRFLFPEHVPHGKAVNDFGNQEFFDTCARTLWRKEHTVQFVTVGSAIASVHFEVTKHDDVVDKENCVTPEQIQKVKDHVGMCGPLVETYAHPTKGEMRGWVDLTGTFYDFSDLNYSIYETEKEKPEEKRTWCVNVESAAPNWPEGPYLWPERVGYKALKAIEDDPAQGEGVLSSQYLMNPTPKGQGLVDDEKEIIWTPRRVMDELYARLTLNVAIDLAGMDTNAKRTADNDFTTITLGGFGTDGHLYIPEVIHGKPDPHAVIDHLFDLWHRHPRIQSFKIEKEAHARVLLPFLKAEEVKRQKWLPIMEIQRDNQVSKKQKIKGLQPWFKRGMIHFADDLPAKVWVKWEIMKFPKFAHDDILDTLCDLMATRDGRITSDVLPSGKPMTELPKQIVMEGPSGKMTIEVPMATAPVTHEFLFGESEEGATVSVDEITGW